MANEEQLAILKQGVNMTLFKNKKSKPDVYVEVLNFARDYPGFTLGELEANFPEDFSWIKREIQFSKIFQNEHATNPAEDGHYLSFDDRFKLLEHEELQDARRSARFALYTASVSILIAVAALIIQNFSIVKTEVVNFPAQVEPKIVAEPSNDWSPF